jgi:copper oxidase (laccase) domain-containing protein
VIAGQARAAGVASVFADVACTRCDNERYYSHRAGDPGRQLGVVFAAA